MRDSPLSSSIPGIIIAFLRTALTCMLSTKIHMPTSRMVIPLASHDMPSLSSCFPIITVQVVKLILGNTN